MRHYASPPYLHHCTTANQILHPSHSPPHTGPHFIIDLSLTQSSLPTSCPSLRSNSLRECLSLLSQPFDDQKGENWPYVEPSSAASGIEKCHLFSVTQVRPLICFSSSITHITLINQIIIFTLAYSCATITPR